MIYTVTCNPSIDYRLELNRLVPGATNRAKSAQMQVGGKGLNVSLVLHSLGVETVAMGFVAGFVGSEIAHRMGRKSCHCRFVHLNEGCSRINVKLGGRAESTELNAPGPEIPLEALAEMEQYFMDFKQRDYMVLAGSVPPSLPPDIYAKWMKMLLDRGGSFVVDAVGETLLQTLPYHPFLIKPNHHELGDLFGVVVDSVGMAGGYGKKLQKMGARNVLISMSGDGAVFCGENGRVYFQPAAKGVVKNDVGAGDSMIAGFLTGWLKTRSYVQALRWGTAAGAASAFSETLAEAEEIEAILATLPKWQWVSSKSLHT